MPTRLPLRRSLALACAGMMTLAGCAGGPRTPAPTLHAAAHHVLPAERAVTPEHARATLLSESGQLSCGTERNPCVLPMIVVEVSRVAAAVGG